MSKVLVQKVTDYNEALHTAVFGMLRCLDGDRIQKGSRILIKPNLLAPASPQRAILTHPAMVRAVAEYVLHKGGHPVISDSPATGSFKRVLKTSGLTDALQGLEVETREFRTSIPVDMGSPFHNLEIAEDVFKTDMVINLPKFKTHSQMLLTLGVKNLFGCIVGLRKPQWHMRTGVDREMFARLLVRIYQTVRPSITLLDGILALEGHGPSFSGVPRHVGVLMGSTDTVALDMTVCEMLKIEPYRLLTNKVAKECDLTPSSIRVEGSLPEVQHFKLPEMAPLLFGPPIFHSVQRKHLIQRPVPDPPKCKLCGECWNYCPVDAISFDTNSIFFNYDQCIRCYCCIEVCPHGALHAEEPLLGRIFQRLIHAGSPRP